MKATLKNYRIAPRKVRLIADFIRGKQVDEALTDLRFLGKRAARPMEKLLQSAIANAKENHSITDEGVRLLYVKEVRVDEGFTLKRFRPRAQGRATPIHKRTSHVLITLGELGCAETVSESATPGEGVKDEASEPSKTK